MNMEVPVSPWAVFIDPESPAFAGAGEFGMTMGGGAAPARLAFEPN